VERRIAAEDQLKRFEIRSPQNGISWRTTPSAASSIRASP
jgi:hypothetical protein